MREKRNLGVVLSVFLAGIALVASLSINNRPVGAQRSCPPGYTDDYCSGAYAPGNCTCYAWRTASGRGEWRYNEFPEDLGDAYLWNDRAGDRHGYKVDTIPHPNAIAVWEIDPIRPWGHVAYVKDVVRTRDGNGNLFYQFTVDEMNACRPPGCQDCVSEGTYTARSGISFIYPPSDQPTQIFPYSSSTVERGDPIDLAWYGNANYYDLLFYVAVGCDSDSVGPLEFFAYVSNYPAGNADATTRMNFYSLETPEHFAYLPAGQWWWKVKDSNGEEWSDWTTFHLVNCITIDFGGGVSDTAGDIQQSDHGDDYCPEGSNPIPLPTTRWPNPVTTPTPPIVDTATPLPPTSTPTFTPVPDPVVVALSNPPPGSIFQSGAHIVLEWNPGPWDQYYCFVEREGQYYNSGWTTNTSWVSPVNDYGGVVWKVKARRGGSETPWSDEWNFTIEGGTGIPPRLIDPTKGAVFQCGTDGFFQWECRSYECLIETWHPAFDAHHTGWTKWHQWLIPPSAVHGGVNYWHGKGRDQTGHETAWTEAWTFTIQGCTPTPTKRPTRTPCPTLTATRTRTATPSPSPTATQTRRPTVTRRPTQTPQPTVTPQPTYQIFLPLIAKEEV